MMKLSPIFRGRFSNVLRTTFIAQFLYGTKFAPHIGTFPYPHVYVKAMLYSAGADGIEVQERAYIQGLIDVLFPVDDQQQSETKIELVHFVEVASSVPQDVEWSPSSSTATVASFLSGSMMTSPTLSRILLYDAVKAAVADGEYSPLEQEHVAKVSRQLGIPHLVTSRIETIATAETNFSARKEAMLRSSNTYTSRIARARRAEFGLTEPRQ